MNKYRIIEDGNGVFYIQQRMFLFFWYKIGTKINSMLMKEEHFASFGNAEKWLKQYISEEKTEENKYREEQ